MRLGYACINSSIPGSFRTCRFATAKEYGISYIKDLAIANFRRTLKILQWNVVYGIPLYRVSSDLIPFGSHPDFSHWKWWEEEELRDIAEDIRHTARMHNLRITIHPGQYNNLSSPTSEVITNTFRDLEFQTRLLEIFGGKDMVLHLGGKYGNSREAVIRFKNMFRALPENTQEYLRLENDDKTYNIAEVFEVCDDLKAKPIFDYHHNICLPSISVLEIREGLEKLWPEGRKKLHLSSGRKGRMDNSHADIILPQTWKEYDHDFGDWDIDLMLETKFKEVSVLNLERLITHGY